MSIEQFIATFAAVLLGNLGSGVIIYGAWRATKMERRLGLKDGGDFLPFPLLAAMLVPLALGAWGALLLY